MMQAILEAYDLNDTPRMVSLWSIESIEHGNGNCMVLVLTSGRKIPVKGDYIQFRNALESIAGIEIRDLTIEEE